MFEHIGTIMMTREEFDEALEENAKKQIQELKRENELLKTRNELLVNAITKLMKKNNQENNDVRVSRVDFLKIYDNALNEMFDAPEDEDNDIYGYDITVHWHGIYCNCGDGAIPCNHIIPAIMNCNEEDDEEY